MAGKDFDRFERSIELRAPKSRVWRAISNPKEFGAWFGLGESLELIGDFAPGSKITGKWVFEGKESLESFCTIETVEPERRVSFFWVPYEVAPGEDHDKQVKTHVELIVEEIAQGTRLTVVESGFSKLPADKQYKRDQNETGWAMQLEGVEQYLLGRVDVKVEEYIARPVAEVFEAIVDPEKLAQYFVTKSSGRMEQRAKLEWEWADIGAKHSVEVVMLEPNEKVIFVWDACGKKTKTTLALHAEGGKTKLVVSESPFSLTEDGVQKALGQTRGWAQFCCYLKAYLEHGISVRHGGKSGVHA
jgi:uncharacterized protein YndB with AHSA1/START domain